MTDAELIEMERGFWGGSEDYYRDHVVDQCLLAFPQMAGVQDRESIAKSVKDSVRWRDVRIAPKGQVPLGENAFAFSYEVTATRDGQPYRALVSSAYVRDGEAWKLRFHQQTPMD